MNLLLRLHDNPNDPVWSVIISIALFLCAVLYVVVYILQIDSKENQSLNISENSMRDTDGCDGSPEQEELLQLQSGQDRQGS